MKLSDLGDRICIMGPSNSGKSTLANAIAKKCNLDVIHLDQLFHIPYSNWQERPLHEFLQLHDEAIKREKWVMDGNYKRCLPQRLSRATGLILLDVSTLSSVLRYINRTLFQHKRYGGLAGGTDRLNGKMFRHIIAATPKNRKYYAELFETVPLPKIRLVSINEINKQFDEWGLTR
ncbi:AAA family ATPase [Dickeya chrysanthemi]|uniref:AAA family ATPase n=1 Tax=Dickeya chrysanthemi TaxID=556 RepID=A0ABU8JIR0_DICCH|nr:AAA family ATPase [Dickeya chrysanthemi]MCA7007823.1 AAA family ATPase [Dickeya chrysanthemi]